MMDGCRKPYIGSESLFCSSEALEVLVINSHTVSSTQDELTASHRLEETQVAGRELCYSKAYHGLLFSKTTHSGLLEPTSRRMLTVTMLHRGIWNLRSTRTTR